MGAENDAYTGITGPCVTLIC